ncbi:MAG TPA: tol-pal system protein YbgF [Gammaproteobacteria bacterium]|nr:tol-pal system protein YbgF [Gammaproteobacteria bacterium]
MRSYRTAMLPAAGLIVLLAGCTMQVKPDDPYAIRQQQLEARVDRLDQLFKNQSLSSMSQRIDDQQDQLRQLRGDVETLEHNVDLTKKQQRDLYLDLDRRLQKLELGTGNSQASNGNTSTAAQPAANDADERSAYQKNFNLVKQGRYDDAINGFTAFIQQYPQSQLVPNAEFWMGESHYQQSDFQGALVNYKAVVQNYPDSSKAPDALLKMGYAQYEMKDWKAARKTLDSVVSKYPDSRSAGYAKQRLQRMKKEGH